MSRFNYIIYHRGCFDGFTGLYLFTKTKAWEPKPFIYPDVPSATELPPQIENKRIIIIDVAYNPKLLKQIAEKAEKVLFLDHHKTHQKEIENLNLPAPHEIIYRMDRCGATLVWDYFFSDLPRPQFLQYIEDNDLGLWEIPETLDFIAGLEVRHRLVPTFDNLKKWDRLMIPEYLSKLVRRGHTYNEYKDFLVKRTAKRHTICLFPSQKVIKKLDLKIPQKKVAVVNGGGPSISLVGKYLAETLRDQCDYCLIWSFNMKINRYIFSFRSREADVGSIAKILGGGGHKLAAGASLSAEDFSIVDLFDPIKE